MLFGCKIYQFESADGSEFLQGIKNSGEGGALLKVGEGFHCVIIKQKKDKSVGRVPGKDVGTKRIVSQLLHYNPIVKLACHMQCNNGLFWDTKI